MRCKKRLQKIRHFGIVVHDQKRLPLVFAMLRDRRFGDLGKRLCG